MKAKISVTNKKAEKNLIDAAQWAGAEQCGYEVSQDGRTITINDIAAACETFDFMVRRLNLNVAEFTLLEDSECKWGFMLKWPNRYFLSCVRVLESNGIAFMLDNHDKVNSYYHFMFDDFTTFVKALRLIYKAEMDIKDILMDGVSLYG